MNPTLHYYVHKRPPPNPIPSQINPVYVLTHFVFKIHFNVVISYTFIAYLPGDPAVTGLHIHFFYFVLQLFLCIFLALGFRN